MKLWSFFDFVDDRGENVIQRWLERDIAPSLTKRVRVKMTAYIQHLEVTARFGRPYTADLHGECEGLLEIILNLGKVQYRPLACYGPDIAKEITLLMGARERGGRFDPPGACPTALGRRSLILADRRYVVPHDFR